jgi:holo-[acyl-carrier protein] synthase
VSEHVLAVGIDVVTVDRVAGMIARKGDHVVNRLLTENEAAYCRSQAVPARHIAARIAAKEAVYKALQGVPEARAIGWRDIEVIRDWDGRPAALLTGRAAIRADQLHVGQVLLSLTHSAETAAAMAVLLRQAPGA